MIKWFGTCACLPQPRDACRRDARLSPASLSLSAFAARTPYGRSRRRLFRLCPQRRSLCLTLSNFGCCVSVSDWDGGIDGDFHGIHGVSCVCPLINVPCIKYYWMGNQVFHTGNLFSFVPTDWIKFWFLDREVWENYYTSSFRQYCTFLYIFYTFLSFFTILYIFYTFLFFFTILYIFSYIFYAYVCKVHNFITHS